MQVCTSLQTDNHASTPLLSFFTGRMPFLPPNQQRQSTEGNAYTIYTKSHLVRNQYFQPFLLGNSIDVAPGSLVISFL